MLKNILKTEGVTRLKRKEQTTINGGINPTICSFGIIFIDCSINTDGRCTCVNGKCVKGPSQHCR